MKTVLAFGDSNTWGLIPGSKDHGRYPREVRWTGVLQDLCGAVRFIEEGLCGRTTAFVDERRPGRNGAEALPSILKAHHPLDAAIVMLGTNDCKSVYSFSAAVIGEGIGLCLDQLEKVLPPDRILLVSPLWLGEDVWRSDKDPEFGKQSVQTSRALKDVYSLIAKERGTAFLAASDHVRANPADEEHMDEAGHRLFAKAVYAKLREMQII